MIHVSLLFDQMDDNPRIRISDFKHLGRSPSFERVFPWSALLSIGLIQMVASLYRVERRALISKTLLRISTIHTADYYDSRVQAGVEMRCRVRVKKQAFQFTRISSLFSSFSNLHVN